MSEQALVKRVEELEAKLAIRDLIDTFPHYLDRGSKTKAQEDFVRFGDLHTDDVTFNHPIAKVNGKKDLANLADKGLEIFQATHHQIANIHIFNLDVEKGIAECHANAIYIHVWKAPEGVKDEVDRIRHFTRTTGTYHFGFRRENGVWRISRNDLTATAYEGIGPIL